MTYFDDSYGELSSELVATLVSWNPWWNDKPGPPTPRFHRWPFGRLQHALARGMTPAIVLRGPRRVGKTVLVWQLIEQLLKDGTSPTRILYVPFDDLGGLRNLEDPVLSIGRWFEQHIVRETFNECAHAGRPAYILLDEVQNLSSWAPQVKNLVDNHAVRMLLTGSSSLRIEAGRDSLAGRITTLDMGPMLLREIASLRFGYSDSALWQNGGLDHLLQIDFWREAVEHGRRQREVRRQAFSAFSQRGAYPVAHQRYDAPWSELASYLNETVIKRAIQHDLRMGTRGKKRDEKLLEEVFLLACRYAGQTPGAAAFVPEVHQALAGDTGWNRISNYLRFLDGTLLLRLIQPLELRLKRRTSPPKICLCDHALRAAWLQEVIPLDPDELATHPHLTDVAGRLAESELGYFLATIPDLDVAHFPMRGSEPEVDFVLTIGTRRIPIEVKYRNRIDPHDDTRGLRAFLEKSVYNAPFGLLVTLHDDVVVPDPRIISMSLSTLLWLR